MKTVRIYSAIIVGIHVIMSLFHGTAHWGGNVGLPLAGSLYVFVVVVIGPLLGLALLYTRWLKLGAIILAVSMLGSLLFGWANHFLIQGDDHVSHVTGAWYIPFLLSGILIFISEAIGTLIGAWAVVTTFRTPAMKYQ